MDRERLKRISMSVLMLVLGFIIGVVTSYLLLGSVSLGSLATGNNVSRASSSSSSIASYPTSYANAGDLQNVSEAKDDDISVAGYRPCSRHNDCNGLGGNPVGYCHSSGSCANIFCSMKYLESSNQLCADNAIDGQASCVLTSFSEKNGGAPDTGICTPTSNSNQMPSPIKIYRFYNTSLGVHFYHTDVNSMRRFPAYKLEGAAFRVLPAISNPSIYNSNSNIVPVYRFFNSSTGAHLFTADTAQRDRIRNNYPQFNYEGIKFYV